MSERRFHRHPDALWLATLRGMVVLPPGTSDATSITSPGDLVWRLLEAPVTFDELLADLTDTFDTPPDVLRADVERLLADLDTIGALEQGAQGV